MAHNTQEQSGFTRADKAVLFAACTLLALLAFFWLLAFMAIGSLGAAHLWNYMGLEGIALCLFVPGLVLLVIRGVDFARGGSTYRLYTAGKRALGSLTAGLYAHNH